MNIYFIICFGGFLGISLHLIVTMQTINKNTSGINFHDVWKQYWKTDYLVFPISILGFIIYVFTLSDFIDLNHLDTIDYKESIADRVLHSHFATFLKTTSVVVGFFSDYLVYKFIGKTKQVIDKKMGES